MQYAVYDMSIVNMDGRVSRRESLIAGSRTSPRSVYWAQGAAKLLESLDPVWWPGAADESGWMFLLQSQELSIAIIFAIFAHLKLNTLSMSLD